MSSALMAAFSVKSVVGKSGDDDAVIWSQLEGDYKRTKISLYELTFTRRSLDLTSRPREAKPHFIYLRQGKMMKKK
jgi:hypothetical protein